MKEIFTRRWISAVLSLLTITVHAAVPCFLSDPTLSPDGKTVVFSYAGDLWKADVKGGNASRLTPLPGYESKARFSPDGKWIAFTGRQTGNADVFVMSMASGEIKPLTYHSATDEVCSWSWDSKTVYFTSERTGQISGYKVGINGGTPVHVLGDFYFQYDHLLFEHPLSGEIFFNNTLESSVQVQRKRYKGAFNPDIQSYNPQARIYKRYTDYPGKDFGAVLDREGNLYFISDEANGFYNLYTFDHGRKKALTTFKTHISNLSVNAEGGTVVFEKDYRLFVFSVKTGQTRLLDIKLPGEVATPRTKPHQVKGNITAVDVSPDGARLAFTSRGELFVSNADGTGIRRIERPLHERALEVKWMNDGETLLFNQTRNGYLNWYTVPASMGAAAREITTDARNNRSISLNAEGTMATYLSGRDEVRVMDLKTWQSKTIVRDEIWALWADMNEPKFSPDGRFICYTAHRNSEEDIFVYELKSGKSVNLTRSGVTETGPLWSGDGRHLYFTASRTAPAFPLGLQNARIYRAAFQELNTSPYSDSITQTTPYGRSIAIDTNRFMEQIEQKSASFGSSYLIDRLQTGNEMMLFSISDQDRGNWTVYRTVVRDSERERTEKVAGAPEGRGVSFRMTGNNNGYFALVNGEIYRFWPLENKMTSLNVSYEFSKDERQELEQVFHNTWSKVEENYYDPTFHGIDWAATKKHYEAFLPLTRTRQDLRVLINDMLGELNSSHQRFNSLGDEDRVGEGVRTMETGIVFSDEAPYRIQRVLARSNADKADGKLLPGDELLAVDGVAIDPSLNRDFYFTKKGWKDKLDLTFKRAGDTLRVSVRTQSTISGNLYDEWIIKNRGHVAARSNGQVAYACMKDMEKDAYENFLMEMSTELEGKAGLILDLRYNDGGIRHDELLRFLAQRTYARWGYRGGKAAPQSHFAPADKPIVLLINEKTLSDAEMAATGFKALGLGKVVGNETYRWEIFTRPFYMVDGSSVRLSAWGCYALNGDDIELTGVKPDVLVINTFEDNLTGKDPQLDRALSELMVGLR